VVLLQARVRDGGIIVRRLIERCGDKRGGIIERGI
jgi:hypothetical protein